MSNKPTASLPCKVVVVMFDRLGMNVDRIGDLSSSDSSTPIVGRIATDTSAGPQTSEHPVNADVPARWNVFDSLDLRSIFFEQYLIQDARRDATATDVFGGTSAVAQFRNRLREHDIQVAHLMIRCAEGSPESIDPADRNSLCFLQDSSRQETDVCLSLVNGGVDTTSLTEVCRREIQRADLLWLDVQTTRTDASRTIAASVLEQLADLTATHPAELRPILIVSAQRGESRPIQLPLISGCDEGLVHVPLWIDHGAGHFSRLQALVGSFDLLPTIQELLTGVIEWQEPESDLPESTLTGREVLTHVSRRPQSWVRLIREFRQNEDRLLPITGDGWRALRSQHYLLVHPANCEPSSPHAENPTSVRRLYLKPDDYWNVHDVNIAYEAIADEMDQLSQGQNANE